MPSVHVLPDALVDQIAAGEVIERPASVVKELVENAFDAGASRVEVEIEGGGVARTSVLDDGCGMEPGDALLALSRHATSKIATPEDLARIGTLGFRGEALPSIASVSRLTLTTAPDRGGLGTAVVADRGAPPRSTPARHPKGTRVDVEDLFGNVPARRKFLKGPEAEQRAIVKTATALALSRPGLSFVLRSGTRDLLRLAPAPDAAGRFAEILGSGTLGEAVELGTTAHGMTLRGAVSRPDVTFASRTWQWLFVNGRLARDATVAHAAQLAAREALSDDRFPAFVLFLECDPAGCDVNVHPQKLEVRFREPSAVHSLVHRALLSALGGAKRAVALPGGSLVTGVPASGPAAPAWSAPGAALALGEALGVWGEPRSSQAELLSPPAASPSRSAYAVSSVSTDVPSPVGRLRLLGQYRESFLVAEGPDGLVLVDQHVAHERVRFEKIRLRLEGASVPSQGLLPPAVFEASPEESVAMEGAVPLLESAGFAVSELAGRTWALTASPTDCPPGAAVPALRDFLARLLSLPERGTKEDQGTLSRTKDALAASLACHGAVTVNTRLSAEEANRLLSDLTACRDPFTCPHGRPILLSLPHTELEKRFGRRG